MIVSQRKTNSANTDKILPSWFFHVEKLGYIEYGDFEIKPLTLFCGPNNTGKTWVMYAVHGFLERPFDTSPPHLPNIDSVIEYIKKDGVYSWDFLDWLEHNSKKLIDTINHGMKLRLIGIFNVQNNVFAHSKFEWSVTPEEIIQSSLMRELDYRLVLGRDKNDALRLFKPAGEKILQITLLGDKLPDLQFVLSEVIYNYLLGGKSQKINFLLPAERNGLHLFFRELSDRRTRLLHHARKEKIDAIALFKDIFGSSYAEPIAHYIDWLNLLRSNKKTRSEDFHIHAEEVKKMVGGRYDVDVEGNISFTPYKLKKGNSSTPSKLELHMASSTVKSLFGLWFYLEHQAEFGDVIMIDEPELNLHPDNQRKVARLLVKLANSGLRVVVSTHSDYIVREINNLVMLKDSFEGRESLLDKFGYEHEDCNFIAHEQIAAYLFDSGKIKAMDITSEEGVIAETFDEVINALNKSSNEIFYTKRDSVE
jgi:hypothetical protein